MTVCQGACVGVLAVSSSGWVMLGRGAPPEPLVATQNAPGMAATKKLPGEGFKRPWPPLIKMDAALKVKVEKLLRGNQ